MTSSQVLFPFQEVITCIYTYSCHKRLLNKLAKSIPVFLFSFAWRRSTLQHVTLVRHAPPPSPANILKNIQGLCHAASPDPQHHLHITHCCDCPSTAANPLTISPWLCTCSSFTFSVHTIWCIHPIQWTLACMLTPTCKFESNVSCYNILLYIKRTAVVQPFGGTVSMSAHLACNYNVLYWKTWQWEIHDIVYVHTLLPAMKWGRNISISVFFLEIWWRGGDKIDWTEIKGIFKRFLLLHVYVQTCTNYISKGGQY